MLMTTDVVVRGVTFTAVRESTYRANAYQDGGLRTIGNCKIAIPTDAFKAAFSEPHELLGEIFTMDGLAWRVFSVTSGDAMTSFQLQRDTEG